MFFEGIRSERKLVETASLNLAHRWYLGYALDEPLPDHSSLTRIRQRLGVEPFARFFEAIVDGGIASGAIERSEREAIVSCIRAFNVGLTDGLSADSREHRAAVDGFMSVLRGYVRGSSA